MGDWVNVGCGPHRAPEPWINLDVHEGDDVHPDVLVKDPMFPLADWEDESVDRVYMGHVLEHIPWKQVPSFLADIHRALKPGGEICVVGPDLLRTIEMWGKGQEPWQMVESVMESPWPYADPEVDGETWNVSEGWEGSNHTWNCYERRVVWALETTELFLKVEPQKLDEASLGTWPVVGYAKWQCAVSAVKS